MIPEEELRKVVGVLFGIGCVAGSLVTLAAVALWRCL